MLFLIYMNDYPDHSDNGEDVLYADDSTRVVSAKDLDTLEIKIQQHADSATEWISDNKMICSSEKISYSKDTTLAILCGCLYLLAYYL